MADFERDEAMGEEVYVPGRRLFVGSARGAKGPAVVMVINDTCWDLRSREEVEAMVERLREAAGRAWPRQ